MSTTHIFVAFQQPDGSWRQDDKRVEEPYGVALETGWVHVVAYDAMGSQRFVRSYPADKVDCVVWAPEEPQP